MTFAPDASFSRNISLEAMKTKIAERLERARNNPILFERYKKINERLYFVENKFLQTGLREATDIKERDLLKREILTSTAVADNIIEFKEMLRQFRSTRKFLVPDWEKETLAHENAHANVSQKLGFDWIGYGMLFIKRPEGLFVQPSYLSNPNISWTPEEQTLNTINVLDAPRVYGNSLSLGDAQDLEIHKNSLERIRLDKLRSNKKKI